MNKRKHEYNEFWMRIAQSFAARSTCARINAGAVIVSNGHIISAGYNGVPQHSVHCIDVFQERWTHDFLHLTWQEYLASDQFITEHHDFAVRNEIHDVMNAVSFAARTTAQTLGATLYATHSMCSECAKLVIASGIAQVFFLIRYRDISGIKLLNANGVRCEQMGGDIVNAQSATQV